MANKIKYGISNVYYAIATIATDHTATYATPKAFPGAVSLSLEPQGEATPFYADNIQYWISNGNNGYQGDLEMAIATDDFKKDILNYITDGKTVLVEDMDAATVHFALLFQFEGDDKATKHILYNCTATRPNVGGTTKNETIEPQTESITITASSIYSSALGKEVVKAEANGDSDSTTYNGWTSAVYQPTAPSTTT